ncbi:hypothetical protein EXE25_18235 [Acinetobacter bouvetii]|uniref:Tetratricopeptide repeat protein n=1 Tax=Acinetobacter bouvetii TaxID=202951 RepID=A0A4Q7ALQ9_9GAMM|nr:hypothetical protein [Acinetobacter bouvetii]RZG63920.1 hypothetical protein EXE25_18235 [Acinetobacter bouvetii]
MNPAVKTVYSDLVSEIFSSTVKTKSEFKIQSWRRKAESLKAVDVFQYKLMLAILDAYISENDRARSVAESALLLTQSESYKGMAYRVIGNCYAHQGLYREALDSYWAAYKVTLDSTYFFAFFGTAVSYDFYDERMNEMKSLNESDQKYIKTELSSLNKEISKLENSNLNLEIYRDILSSAYAVFFSSCAGKIIRYPDVSDSNVSTILFNPELDLATIGLLNDEMSNALVDLLEKYEYEELLKYPIIFTSDDYSIHTER